MFWPSTQPSSFIANHNELAPASFATSSGVGVGPKSAIPTRATFPGCCASTASGAARRPRASVATRAVGIWAMVAASVQPRALIAEGGGRSLVGSRTGAVPTWVRLQPPPHRTARTDSPYAALLSASCHGLWALSTGSAFGRGPMVNPVISEESELVMEPCRTPPLTAEAATAPRPHEMSPHSLLDPQPHIRQAPTRVPDPEVVHPPPKLRVALGDQPTHRL